MDSNPMIVRTEKNKNYTSISNYALKDSNLSLKAKGLWAFIMAKPDDWNINSRGLSTELKEGRESIMSALRELEQAGYLKRGKRHETNGKFSTSPTTLYEKPWTGKPTTVNPTIKVNTEKLSTEEDNTKVLSKKIENEKNLLDLLNRTTSRNFRVLPHGSVVLLKTFTLNEIEKSLKALAADPWHRQRLGELGSSYLLRASTIDKFLNATPRSSTIREI